MSRPRMPENAHEVYRRYLAAVVLHGQASGAAVGLGGTDLYALSVLAATGSMTPGELAARTGLTSGATTRLIDRLERDGHVRRVADPTDRRRLHVEPTGRDVGVDAAVDPARRKVGDILAGYTAEQLTTLFDYFTRAATAFEEATEELQAAAERRH
ncbi:MarR family winged helix-turn-helix transcriptional regulator [Actinoallomurus iriomotensis]|nr:MarR family transcriptional regulator [Actinoallomurus iriomotensis]